jgi:MFS family permease
MLLLDITVVVVALPRIQSSLTAGLTGLQWVVDAYALALAALILTAGALADRYGRRLMFIFGAAWSIAALDIARGLQGIGGAALFATALALIGYEYRGRDLFGAIAVWGATIGAAVASGPLVGGLLTDGLGWRWIFFVNVPVGAFALLVAFRYMAESRDEGAVRTDLAGLVTFSAALFLIVFGLLRGNSEGWSSTLIVSTLAVGVAMLGLFVLVELRQRRAMLDMSLFRRPAFVGVSLSTFALGAGMFAMFPYLSI